MAWLLTVLVAALAPRRLPVPPRSLPRCARMPSACSTDSDLSPQEIMGRLTKSHSAERLMAVHLRHGSSFNEIHLPIFWNRLGRLAAEKERLSLRRSDRLRPMMAQTIEMLPQFDGRGVSSTLHALARLGLGRDHRFDQLFAALGRAAVQQVDELNPQALSNTAWAFATAGRTAPALFDALATAACARIDEFNHQDLASTAWAFATAGHAAPALFDAVAGAAAERVDDFSPQALTNTAWAFATAGHAAPALFDALASAALARLDGFTPQALANVVWAFATAGHAAPALFDAVAAAAAPRAAELGPQMLASSAWAFAASAHPAPALFEAIAREACTRAHALLPQSRASIAWAFAKAGHVAPTLFDALAREGLAQQARDYSPHSLSNTAWAFATAGHKAPELFDALASAMLEQLDSCNPQDLASTAWAFATAGQAAPALFDALGSEAAEHLTEFSPQGISNVAWAFAVADVPSAGIVGASFIERCEATATEDVALLCQLHQFELWRREHGICEPPLSSKLRRRCHDAFCSTAVKPSALQRSVGKALGALGLEASEEVRTKEGYTLDWVVKHQGALVGVEVDGPHHFVGRDPTGATLLKRRQLRHLGWRLISVPYWEWNELEADGGAPATRRSRQAAFLREKLEQQGG